MSSYWQLADGLIRGLCLVRATVHGIFFTFPGISRAVLRFPGKLMLKVIPILSPPRLSERIPGFRFCQNLRRSRKMFTADGACKRATPFILFSFISALKSAVQNSPAQPAPKHHVRKCRSFPASISAKRSLRPGDANKISLPFKNVLQTAFLTHGCVPKCAKQAGPRFSHGFVPPRILLPV